MKKVLIMIPAYNPPAFLVDYIDELIANGYDSILVINDGSREEFNHTFETISQKPGCKVYSNIVNCGKGRGLKNGFTYYLNNYDLNEFCGVVTVDSDGQHAVSDIKNVVDEMIKNDKALILGSRDFNKEDVPFRSSFGNKLTSKLFKLLYGKKLMDTQTGFRGFPNDILKHFIALDGERFEYETNMLIECSRKNIEMIETVIQTIYIDNNSESHFNPIIDSFKIYRLLLGKFLKYIASSALSFLLDVTLFQIFIWLLSPISATYRITASTVMARICSSIFNYNVNKRIVFENKSKHTQTVWKYYTLCIVEMTCSATFVSLLYKIFPYSELLVKVCVDTVLFIISFIIQKNIVFKKAS